MTPCSTGNPLFPSGENSESLKNLLGDELLSSRDVGSMEIKSILEGWVIGKSLAMAYRGSPCLVRVARIPAIDGQLYHDHRILNVEVTQALYPGRKRNVFGRQNGGFPPPAPILPQEQTAYLGYREMFIRNSFMQVEARIEHKFQLYRQLDYLLVYVDLFDMLHPRFGYFALQEFYEEYEADLEARLTNSFRNRWSRKIGHLYLLDDRPTGFVTRYRLNAMQNYPWLRSYPQGFRWDAILPVHPLFVLLDEAEDRYASRVAIDFLGRKITYAELGRDVRALASGLRQLGVEKGVKVGLLLPNCPQFVTGYYAILKAGGTVVNFNPLYSAREIAHQIEDSSTEVMITVALKATYPKLAECLGKTKLKRIIVSEFQEALPLAKRLAFPVARKNDIAAFPDDERHTRYAGLLHAPEMEAAAVIHPESDVAVLQYTGGTTGVPKGAVLTHANIYANTLQCGLWFTGLEHGAEIIMGALPLFHVFAMATVMNLAIHTGSTMLLHPKFDLKAVLHDIHAKRPSLMPGVPTMFAAMQNFRGIEKYDLTSLKMCMSGGGPLPERIKLDFEHRTGCKLIEGYGLTETSPVVSANPLFDRNKAGSIGLPFPGTIMEITDPDDPNRLLGIREVGEVCVRGPQVMRGYLHQLDETRRTLRGGRLHTGDMGYMDEEGYFFIVDRIKEMIISGGYNIYPRNIEEVLYRHPAVAEAAVIGIHHPQRVQVPKAFIVRKEGMQVSESELRDHLKADVASYAMPYAYEFRDSLPKSLIGKVLKKELVAEEKLKSG